MAPLTLKTPGVYIQELNAFTNSIVPVPTAVPVFIGYTEKAMKGTESLHMLPTKISSMKEYEDYFGGAPTVTFGLVAEIEGDAGPAVSNTNEDAIAIAAGKKLTGHTFKPTQKGWFILHTCMQMFFDNGGSDCFVLSVNTYDKASGGATKDDFYNPGTVNVFEILENFTEPTMIVIPEAALMYSLTPAATVGDPPTWDFSGAADLQVQSLMHCAKMQTCFSIMDVPKGYPSSEINPFDYNTFITDFQNGIGINDLKWGAAYFPWLHTNVTPSSNISFMNIDVGKSDALLGKKDNIVNFFSDTYTPIATANIQGASPTAQKAATFEKPFVTDVVAPLKPAATPGGTPTQFDPAELAKKPSWTLKSADITKVFPTTAPTTITVISVLDNAINEQFLDKTTGVLTNPIQAQKLKNALQDMAALIGMNTSTWSDADKASFQSKVNGLNNMLLSALPAYKENIQEMADKLNMLPPSAAMAGLYSMTDHQVGVWKAPANISVADAIRPAVHIGFEDQEDLNVPLNGKAINAIRFFNGKGVIVWGARTLDGNSQDWRYINVRRTITFIEQSVKVATQAFVFDANDAQTWGNLKSMISQFLTSVWAQGGLAGAKASDAFSVSCGLGETMTAVDILNGRLNVMVKVAVSHPAEFIVITVQQQLQKS